MPEFTSANHRVTMQTRKVKRGDVPTWRVTDWEPLEISAVAIPADAGAQVCNGERFDCEVRLLKV